MSDHWQSRASTPVGVRESTLTVKSVKGVWVQGAAMADECQNTGSQGLATLWVSEKLTVKNVKGVWVRGLHWQSKVSTLAVKGQNPCVGHRDCTNSFESAHVTPAGVQGERVKTFERHCQLELVFSAALHQKEN